MVLLAGHGVEGRKYRALEAVQAAIAVANWGLEVMCQGADAGASLEIGEVALQKLKAVPLDRLFRLGWASAHDG